MPHSTHARNEALLFYSSPLPSYHFFYILCPHLILIEKNDGMFTTLTILAGLRIDDERIKDFLEKNGFKYPKKPFISNRSSDTSYWIENKKLGLDLLFNQQL